MSQIIEPLNDRARAFADYAQPVIVALSTAGLTGGAMAAVGLLADTAWRRRSRLN
jgi:hypothetical protein